MRKIDNQIIYHIEQEERERTGERENHTRESPIEQKFKKKMINFGIFGVIASTI